MTNHRHYIKQGALQGGKEIAVLTLQREGKLVKQHQDFVKAVSKLSHRNLLKLDGYCIDEQGSFICYEYQRYQTLEECLITGNISHTIQIWHRKLASFFGPACYNLINKGTEYKTIVFLN